MQNNITINMGEMAVGSGNTHIITGSIGSCICITLYDEKTGIGGMTHAMLPSKRVAASDVIEEARANIQTPQIVAKYADEAVDRLILEIEKLGGRKENLRGKLTGGARMFKILSGDKFGIGYQNAETAKKRLEELGIPIDSEDTGGTAGRSAELSLENGLLEVKTSM